MPLLLSRASARRPRSGGGLLARARGTGDSPVKSRPAPFTPAAKVAKHSGTDLKKIEKDCDRNLSLDPAEARQ